MLQPTSHPHCGTVRFRSQPVSVLSAASDGRSHWPLLEPLSEGRCTVQRHVAPGDQWLSNLLLPSVLVKPVTATGTVHGAADKLDCTVLKAHLPPPLWHSGHSAENRCRGYDSVRLHCLRLENPQVDNHWSQVRDALHEQLASWQSSGLSVFMTVRARKQCMCQRRARSGPGAGRSSDTGTGARASTSATRTSTGTATGTAATATGIATATATATVTATGTATVTATARDPALCHCFELHPLFHCFLPSRGLADEDTELHVDAAKHEAHLLHRGRHCSRH